MSAKDQVLQLVNKFKKENYLKDKTNAMGDGLLLGANLADEANERSKLAREVAEIIEENYRQQILAQDLNPNKDPELVDLRNGEQTAGERIAKFENATNNYLANRELNLKSPPVPMNGAKGDGSTDDTPAIQSLLNHLGSLDGGKAILPYGVYRITSGIRIPNSVQLAGYGYTTDPLKYGPTAILKDGNFKGVTLAGTSSGIENVSIFGKAGNGDAGLVLGGGRCFVNKVTVANQGGNGIEIGDLTGSNVNLFRILDIVTMFNTGHGLYIDSIGGDGNLPDVNAGYIQGVDARSNGGDGVRVGRAMDITFISLASQHNSGYGVRNVAGSKGMVFLAPYTEENAAGEFIFETGSNYNIAIGYRAGEGSDSFENHGLGNLVLGRNNQIESGLPTFNSKVGFKELIIEDPTLSGYWSMKENPTNRALEIILDGTAQSNVKANLKHGGSGVVVFNPQRLDINDTAIGGYTLRGHKHIESGLSFASVLPNSTKEATLTVTGVSARNVVNASPDSMPAGIIWSAYVSGADTIKIRLANVTTNEITVGNVPFSVDVWQH